MGTNRLANCRRWDGPAPWETVWVASRTSVRWSAVRALTEAEIRAAFVNASRGEAKRASVPDLAGVAWEQLDYLGWHDEKRPQLAYVSMEVEGTLVTVMLRSSDAPSRRRILCAWCQDVLKGDKATFYAAPRAGASGRRGNTIGTAICPQFQCSANVRRTPSIVELSSTDPEEHQYWIDLRVHELRRRASRFLQSVMRDDTSAAG